MPNNSANKTKFNPAEITKPIPLLAFVGTLIEGIIGVIAYASQNSPYFPILALALIIIPFFLVIIIYLLITKHHEKLYAPGDFSNPDHFIELIRNSSKKIEDFGSSDQTNIFLPFHYHKPLPKEQQEMIRRTIANVEPILEKFNASDFEILHSWYNSIDRHNMALLCINIALAQGATKSKNFSYRSASLRKLGRLMEALHSALMAIELDSSNVDAYYNLSIVYMLMGNQLKAKDAAKIVYASKSDNYIQKLQIYLNVNNVS